MIITIARDVGSQGEEVGRAIAQALDLPYFDNEIIARAARSANVSAQTIEQAERAPSLLSRMIDALGRFPASIELADAAPGLALALPLSNDAYRAFIEEVIRGLARGMGGVIIGHGAQIALRGHADALHVRVTAPFDDRIRVMMAAEGIARDDARRRLKQADQDRTAFFQRAYQVDWRDPALYDITLSTGRLPAGRVADIVAGLVRQRRER